MRPDLHMLVEDARNGDRHARRALGRHIVRHHDWEPVDWMLAAEPDLGPRWRVNYAHALVEAWPTGGQARRYWLHAIWHLERVIELGAWDVQVPSRWEWPVTAEEDAPRLLAQAVMGAMGVSPDDAFAVLLGLVVQRSGSDRMAAQLQGLAEQGLTSGLPSPLESFAETLAPKALDGVRAALAEIVGGGR